MLIKQNQKSRKLQALVKRKQNVTNIPLDKENSSFMFHVCKNATALSNKILQIEVLVKCVLSAVNELIQKLQYIKL